MNLRRLYLFRFAVLFVTLGLAGCGGGAATAAAKSTFEPGSVTISGKLSGLAQGQQLTLSNNGTNAMTLSVNGAFNLPVTVLDAGNFEIRIGKAPLNQSCVVVDGSGSGVVPNMVSVSVTCTTYANCVSISPEACGLFHSMTAGLNLANPFSNGVYDKVRFTDAQVDDLCRRFDTFRLMLPFFNTAVGTLDEALIASSRRAAERFVACGATVIVTHTGLPTSMGWLDAIAPEARLYELWRKVGQTYRGTSPKIIFELLNEPGLAQDSPRLNAVMHGMLAALRSTGVQNVAMLSPRGVSEAGYLSGVVFPDDRNIIYTIHQYAPLSFTGQGNWWSATLRPPGVTCCDATQVDTINRYLKLAYDWTQKVGYPIVVSEYGSPFCADQTSRKNFIQENVTRFQQWDLTPVLFSYDDALGIFERSSMTWDPVLLPLIQKPSAGAPPGGFSGYAGSKYCK